MNTLHLHTIYIKEWELGPIESFTACNTIYFELLHCLGCQYYWLYTNKSCPLKSYNWNEQKTPKFCCWNLIFVSSSYLKFVFRVQWVFIVYHGYSEQYCDEGQPFHVYCKSSGDSVLGFLMLWWIFWLMQLWIV